MAFDPQAVLQQQQAQASPQPASVLPGQGAVNVQTNVNTGKSPAMAKLVDSLAAGDMIKQGYALQERGRQTQARPKNYQYLPGGQLVGMGSDWRNTLAGSLEGHWGRQKVAEGIEANAAQQMAQRSQQAKAAANWYYEQTGDQGLADGVHEMVLAGMKMPDVPEPEPHAGFDVRDKIYDDSKDTLKSIYKTQTAMEVMNAMVEKGYESGVAQIGAMYSFIKGIDPESVVRPSETDLVGLAESYIQQMQNIVTRVEKGVVTSEEVFNDLAELTGRLNEVQIEGARRAMDDHIGRARVEGYGPERIWGESFARRYALGPPEAKKPGAGSKRTTTTMTEGSAAGPQRTAEDILAEAEAVLQGQD